VTHFRRYLIAAIALIIVTADCSSSHTTRPASSFPTTAKSGTVTTTPRLPAGLTAEQLDAHLGGGVPAGWVPVDEGGARVFVPNDWVLKPIGSCGGASLPGEITIGFPNVGCDQPGSIPPPAQAVALLESSPKHTGQPSLIVHGYRVYDEKGTLT